MSGLDGWVTIRMLPIWQAELDAGRLNDEGIETYLPDTTIKTMDPFATGGLPLLCDLMVQIEDAERASALLESYEHEPIDEEALTAAALGTPPDPSLGVAPESRAATGADPVADPQPADEASPADGVSTKAETEQDPETVEARQEEVETLARRTRWGALAVITMPFAVYFGTCYMRACADYGVRDMKHGLTIAAFWLALILMVPYWLLVGSLFLLG